MREASAIKLLPKADPIRLSEDYRSLIANATARPAGFSGEGHRQWTSLDLSLSPDDAAAGLGNAPYLSDWLSNLGQDLRAVRLMRLAAGGEIKPHRDAVLSGNTLRLHLPILTSELAFLSIDGVQYNWKAGELWAGDFTKPHSGCNLGDDERVHAVVDVVCSSKIGALVPKSVVLPNFILTAMEAVPTSDSGSLKKFEGDFLVPADLDLTALGFGVTTNAAHGAIRVLGSELWIYIDGQPLLKGRPDEHGVLDIEGLGLPAILSFSASTANGPEAEISLTIGDRSAATFSFRPLI